MTGIDPEHRHEKADDLSTRSPDVLGERVIKLQEQVSQLEQQSARYRALFETSPVGHLIMTEDGLVLEANATAERMMGLDEGDLAGASLMQYVCNDDQEQYQGYYTHLFETREPQSFEVRLNYRGGRQIDTRIECGVLDIPTLDHSAVCHMILNDVSLYRDAQRVLSQSEARYRLLFENSPVALWEQDFSRIKASLDELKAEGIADLEAYLTAHPAEVIKLWGLLRTLDVNRTAVELYEADSKEDLLNGLPIPRNVKHLNSFRDSLLAISRGESEFSTERTSQTLTGERIDVALHWALAPGFEASYEQVLVSQTDITRLKQMETELAQRELLYRTMLGNLPGILVMIYDHEMRYMLVEGEAVDALGSSAEEIEGKTIFETLLPRAATEMLPYFRAALQGETVRFKRVAKGFTFDVMVLPVHQDHKIIGGLIFARDVSEDKEREVVIWQERQRIARELHDSISQTLFSANMIVDALPYIAERSPERLPTELEKLRTLTNGALAEMRGLLVELRPYAIAEAGLDELLSQLIKSNASRTDTSFSLSINELEQTDLPVGVKEAFYRIAQQALNNVINHAKAEQATIVLQVEPGRAALTIRDNGRGFDIRDVPEGRMGLVIMQERAESIGAVFELKAQSGEGVEIKVTWHSSQEEGAS